MPNITIKEAPEKKDLTEIIYTRRAVRKFKDLPVAQKMIDQVIDAGRMAPSAINKQPWRFYVLRNKTKIASISRQIAAVALHGFVHSGVKEMIKAAGHLLHFSKDFDFSGLSDPVFHGAPVVIFITAPTDNEWAPLDIGMCSQNMMLTAKSLGLDSCPVGFAKYVDQTKSYPDLKIPGTEKVALAIILGFGDEKPLLHERKKDNVFYID